MIKKIINIFHNTYKKNRSDTVLKNLTILYVSDNYWFASKGYKLYKYLLDTKEWIYFSTISDKKNAVLSGFFLTRRLFRSEITHLYKFTGDNFFCIAKKGIFRLEGKIFRKCFSIKRGSRPMNLCQDKNGTIYFGEYFANPERNPVHVYKTNDFGDSWQIAYIFSQNSINHIHGIFRDPFTERLWITTGDLDDECMIGYSEDGFQSIIPVYKGKQEYRACVLLYYEDRIIYATDSQYVKNSIKEIDKVTGKITDLCQIKGSGIYGEKLGNTAFISTTVEPSHVNTDRNSYLMVSNNGKVWEEVLHFKKDHWHPSLFQFGSMRFPVYDPSVKETNLIVSGRALKGLDGNSLILPLKLSVNK